jgi:2-polyprenyl-6-hydroxyphenyl methylase/3-demethylubiquinone-9 3-methyltransferase
MQNFLRCKLCGEESAAPLYKLQDMVVHACCRCDLHFIDYLDELSAEREDRGVLEEKARKFIDERLPSIEGLLTPRIALLANYLELCGARCLDIGAGVGQFIQRLNAAGAQGYGIEPSRLRRQFAAERFGLKLHPEPVENRCWERFSDYFDAVTLWEVIEHVNDPLATVRGACRLLKTGGLIFLETPSRTAPAYRLSEWCYRLSRGQFPLFLGNFYAPIPFGHKQIFTPGQLSALMESNGFQVIFRGNAFPGDAQRTALSPRDKIILIGQKTGR